MTKAEFEKVLEQKTRELEETQPIDRAVKRHYWLKKLDGFYSKVEEYLAQYIASRKISLKKIKVSITEVNIGEYKADSMEIFLGSDKVTLMPIGTMLFGARGRVDMTGPAGTVKFILTEKNSNGVRTASGISGGHPPASLIPSLSPAPKDLVWKIATPPPKVRFIDLELETFFSALAEVVNG